MAIGPGQPAGDGILPVGKQIAERNGRHERWGWLVKYAGIAGKFVITERP
jgi:hypothetical protein